MDVKWPVSVLVMEDQKQFRPQGKWKVPYSKMQNPSHGWENLILVRLELG